MKKIAKCLFVVIGILMSCLFITGCEFGEVGDNQDNKLDKGKQISSMQVINIPEDGIDIGGFNEANVQLQVTYSDDSVEYISITEDMLTEEGKALIQTPGTYDLNLMYKGVSVEFSITIKNLEYVVTFVNVHDVVVKTCIYRPRDGIAVEPPTAEEMAVEGYRFLGTFDKDFTNVNSDMTIKGQYAKLWVVRFLNAKDEVVSVQSVEEGTNAIAPTAEEMAVEGYRFLGTFDKDFSNIIADLDVKGEYVKVWTVRFFNGNQEVISLQIVDDGAPAEEPTDYQMENACSLLFWDSDFSCITEDLDVYGLFTNHVVSGWIVDPDATCTETGYKYKECLSCHNKLAESIIPAKGHEYQVVVVREARCNQDGEIKYVCECGDSYSIITHAEHFMKVVERVESTCTQDGYIKYSCDNCDDEDYVDIMPQGHDYQMEQVGATLVYTCSRCGDSYSEILEEIEATGNVLLIQDRIPWDTDNAVALLRRLESNGLINGWTITTTNRFSEVDLSSYEVIYIANDQTTATYNRLAQLNSALTAFAEAGGVIVYGACDNGWASGEISYPIVGGVSRSTYYSRYNYIIDEDHPVVTGVLTDGVGISNYLLEGTYCSHSAFVTNTLPVGYNAILQDSRGIPTLVEYGVGNGYVIASGLTWEFYYTRGFKGNTTYSKNVYDDLIVYAMSLANPCDHVLVASEIVEPTCIAKGYTVYICEVCQRTIYGDYTDMVGHRAQYVAASEKTCFVDGNIEHYKCLDCGRFFSDQGCEVEIPEVIIPAGHDFADTLTYDSTHHWYDAICGHNDAVNKIPHTMSSWTIVDDGNGEEIERRDCQCGYYETRQILKGSIKGRVYGTSANGTSLLYNAEVTIIDENNGEVSTTFTDSNGIYVFDNVRYGELIIKVSKGGYISVTQNCYLNMQNMQNEDIYLVLDESNIPGYAQGKAKDASTANGISGITINIRSGNNNTTGTILQTLTTGSNGYYETNGLMAGNYTFEFVDNRGYVIKYGTTVINVVIVANSVVYEQDASMINISGMDADTMKIVLTWGSTPRDLDSHLYVDSGKDGSSDYHVSYMNKSTGGAVLDVDDTSAYGPETITIDLNSNTSYLYWVHNYSGGGSSVLSNSGATVKVYVGVSETPLYTFNVPNGNGTNWQLFEYDADTGEFTIYNTIS